MTHPRLDRLLADVGAPVRRIVFARGIEAAWHDDYEAWRLPEVSAAAPAGAMATLTALGLRPIGATDSIAGNTDARAADACDGEPLGGRSPAPSRSCATSTVDPLALAVRHGLAPLLLATATALGGEATHVVSAMGTLGWRPPLERLYEDPTLGQRAHQLRFLLDAIEHHAARAADGYADAAARARRTAAMFGARDLATLGGGTSLLVELDALLTGVQRTYGAAGRLVAAAFPAGRSGDRLTSAPAVPFDALVLGARTAPRELRESLLDAWDAHGAHASAYRRALRTRDARDLGHAPVQLARLAPELWGICVPVPTPPGDRGPANARVGLPRRVDALDRAWALATDAMRVTSLVVYAVAER